MTPSKRKKEEGGPFYYYTNRTGKAFRLSSSMFSNLNSSLFFELDYNRPIIDKMNQEKYLYSFFGEEGIHLDSYTISYPFLRSKALDKTENVRIKEFKNKVVTNQIKDKYGRKWEVSEWNFLDINNIYRYCRPYPHAHFCVTTNMVTDQKQVLEIKKNYYLQNVLSEMYPDPYSVKFEGFPTCGNCA